jgi:hypothetical protein
MIDRFEVVVSTARLIQVRVASIKVQRPKIGTGGGELLMRATAAVRPHKETKEKATAKLVIELTGVSKASPNDEPEFTAEVEVRGVYKWPRAISEEDLHGREMAMVLSQPLYVKAVGLLEQLLDSAGIAGASIEPDLRLATDINESASGQKEKPGGKKPKEQSTTRPRSKTAKVASKPKEMR